MVERLRVFRLAKRLQQCQNTEQQAAIESGAPILSAPAEPGGGKGHKIDDGLAEHTDDEIGGGPEVQVRRAAAEECADKKETEWEKDNGEYGTRKT